jgi:hypothetical protein
MPLIGTERTLFCRILDDNAFNGSMDMGRSISSELSVVSFKDNQLSAIMVPSGYNGTLA